MWTFFTKKLLTAEEDIYTGDLSRMGYFSSLSIEKHNEINLKKLHIKANEYNGQKIDMITIGDSFSNGGANGLNRFYQDYIASKTEFNVLNLMNYQDLTRSYIETVYLLGNAGFLEKSGVKYILIESVARKATQRFVQEINPKIIDTLDNIWKFYKFDTPLDEKRFLPDVSFINNGNFKFLQFKLMYNFSDNAISSKVFRVKLSKDLFTMGDKTLLFYKDSISSISSNTEENLKMMNDNFNNLADYLSKMDIKLIYMPAVNKYDLYQNYIINQDKYKEDTFFENLRKFDKRYYFVDTKKILKEKIDAGVKDVFYIDDTHWSYLASDILTDYISKIVNDK